MSDTSPGNFRALCALVFAFGLLAFRNAEAQPITLAWTPSPGPNVAGNIVYYGNDATNYNNQIDVGVTDSVTISTLQPGVRYYFQVVAYDTNHVQSPPSQAISYTIPVVTWTVTATANPSASGSVTGGGVFANGSTTTVTATPNSGYIFVDWAENGNEVSDSSAYNFIAVTNRNLIANFTATTTQYTVTATSGNNGIVTPAGSQTVAAGSSVAFVATPAVGYQVGEWTVNGTAAQTGGLAFNLQNVTTNVAVVVNFTTDPIVAVTVNPANAGAVVGGGAFPANSLVTVAAAANKGYTFTNWTENGIVQSASPNYSFTVTGNRNLVANFTANAVIYTVTALAGDNGGISPNGALGVTEGGAMTFTATPASGYHINQWLVGGLVAQSGGSSFTFSNVSSNAVVSVTFSANPTVAVAASPAYAGNVAGGGSFTIGSSATVSASANSGYTFTNWTENGVVQSSSPTYTFVVSGNRNLVANFTGNIVTYLVTAISDTNGVVVPVEPQTVVKGGSVTFAASPTNGYQVNQWVVGGFVAQTGGTNYTLLNVNSNTTVEVSFEPQPTVTLAVSITNAGSVSGGGAFVGGTTVTVTATANSGYTFTNWTENGVVQSSSSSYTFVISSSRNLVANFTVNPTYYSVAASAGTNGSVSPNSFQTVIAGGTITFTATPASSFQIGQWLVGGTVAQTGGSTYILSDVTSNTVVTVNFTANPTVAVMANPVNGGIVSGGGIFVPGASVTVTAAANSGYTFTNWTENGVVQSASPNYTFVVSANRNLVANFSANTVTYLVTAIGDTNGSVDPAGSQTVVKGGSLTFTASPTNGYQVKEWLVGGSVAQTEGTNYILQNVNSNTTVEVSFEPEPKVTLAASSTNAGSVAGGGVFEAGTTVSVTATANSGYTFTNWTENGVVQSSSSSYTFVISSSRNLVANFTVNPTYYSVAASAGNNGSVNPSSFQTVIAGGAMTFTATAGNNFQIGQWLVGGNVVQTGGATYTLSDVSSNTLVSVNFAADPTIAVMANPVNAGVVAGGGSFVPGASATVTATANGGYTFSNWTENGIVQSASPNYSFLVSANRNLVANFSANTVTYLVTAIGDTNGNVGPAGTQTVIKGGSAIFTATPTNGYQVKEWLVSGSVAQTEGTNYILQNVNSNTTVEVSFEPEPKVTLAASSTNAGSVAGGGVFEAGTTVSVTATANSGYTFTNWTENGVVQSSSSSYTFVISSSRNLVANFTVNPTYYSVAASAGNNGSVNPSSFQTVIAGGAMTFTATAGNNFQIGQWLVGGNIVQTGGATYTLSDVSSNTLVSVNFAADPTIAVMANPVNAGVVAGGGSFVPGASATVTATANGGYTFSNWTENGIVQSASPNYSFLVSANRNLVANFSANTVTYLMTAIGDTNGNVDPAGTQTVVKGGAAIFTATPTNGYQVNRWLVGGLLAQTGGTNFTLLNANSNTIVEVSFEPEPVVVVGTSSTNGGSVSGGGVFVAGSTVTVTAAANSGYAFTNWTENGVVQSFSAAYSFVISANRNLVANFTANPTYYGVAASAGANGSVNPSSFQTVIAGGATTFTATPGSGFQVSQWLVGGIVAQTGGAAYTLSDVTSNTVVIVNFTMNPTVAVTTSPVNAGNVTGSGVYTTGSTVIVTAAGHSGYTFTNWSENGGVQSSSPDYSFVVSGNRSLVANFTANIVTYTVTSMAETNGEIDPAGLQSVTTGQSVNFTTTPTNGYQVSQWYVGGALAQTGGTNYTLLNVHSNTTVAVSFAAEPTVVVTASSTNAGSVIGGGAFAAGSTVTVAAVAKSGYTFTNWTENGVVQSASSNYTFVISADRNLVANFAANPIYYTVQTGADANGNVNPPSQTALAGSGVTFTATPNSGYQVNLWSVGGAPAQTGGSTYTLSDVTSNTLVNVTFAANPTVAVSANPGKAGGVTGGGAYSTGSAVTVTAAANTGYTFTNWTENGVVQSSSPSYSFVISGNRNLVANFTANIVAYSVSGVAETNGEIDPAGSQSVSIGQSVNFIATPTNGYQVGQWFVGGLLAQTGGTNFALVNVNSNTTVEVSFEAEPTVVVAASSTNAGSVIGGGAFVAGSTVTVTATAKNGYTFTNWTENGVVQSASSNYTFVLSADRNLVANFTANPIYYTVQAGADANGNVNPPSQTALAGSGVTFTATPNSGYQVNLWTVGGVLAQTGGSTYTLANVTSNTLVSVTFAANPTVAVSANPGKAGVVTGGGAYVTGSTVTVTATANGGYTFTNWTENGVVQSSSLGYSFVISGNRNLVANFIANLVTYSVSDLAETNGEIDPAGSQTVSAGGTVNYIATPNNGYQVNEWFVGGALAQTGGTNFALVNVNSNTTVEVSFEPEPRVAVAASSTSAGTVLGGGAFVAGSTVTVTATAKNGYTFTNWTENGVVQSASSNYTFVISESRNLVANFTVNPTFYTVQAAADANGIVKPGSSQSVLAGSSVTYTATPDSGYQINQWWAGGVVAQAGGSTFTLSDISSNMLVIVSFAANPTVATSVNPGNAGIVTGGGSYVSGSAVTLTATANSGYTFTNWTENGVVQSALASYSFVVSGDRNLVANFTANKVTYTVTGVAETNGTVNPSGGQVVARGGSTILTAAPTNGYQINQWLIDGFPVQMGGTNYMLLNVVSNTTVQVTFAPMPTVIVAPGSISAGTVSGGGAFAAGSSVKVTATANSGYTFANWTENGVVLSISPSYNFIISGNRNLVANFTLNPVYYTVSANAGNNGSVSPTTPQSILANNNATFTATPAGGYEVSQWLVGGVVAQTGGTMFILSGVTSNSTVSVTFVPNPTLSVVANPANAGTVSGGGVFAGGTTVTVTATANSGYTFTNWTENGVILSSSPSFSFILTGDHNLAANFAAKPVMFAVTASARDNGSISPGGTQMVAAGSAVTFNATPASGFQVNQWLVGGLPTQSGGSTYTLREVVTNSTIAVTFNLTNGAITNFTLLVKGHGSVSGYRAGQVMHMGRKYVIAAVPAKGSLFACWSSNGTVVATAPSYTFMAESNLLVQATFVTNPFIPVDGLYHGLFYETNGLAEDSSGLFVATVASSGVFSARIQIGGVSYARSAKFSLAGDAEIIIPRGKLPPITMQLQLDFANSQILGTIANGTWSANLVAERGVYSATNPAPETGRYTMVIPGATNSSGPVGNGYAIVTVSAAGQVALSGVLGDGTPVSTATIVGTGGLWPLYIPLPGGQGSIFGWLSFANGGNINGSIAWFKLPQPRNKYYPGGFAMQCEVIGSAYHDIKGVAPFNITSDEVALIGGDLTQPLDVQLGIAAQILGVGPGFDKLIFTPTSGFFRVVVKNTTTNKAINVSGVVLQNQNYGAGLFLGADQTGSVVLIPGQ